MKKRRLTALLLVPVLLLQSLAGCVQEEPLSEKTEPEAQTTAQPETKDPDMDDLPENLNFDGRTYTLFTVYPDSMYDTLAGPDELVGESVDDAVFNRNYAVEERLQVDLVYDYRSDLNGTTISNEVYALTLAGEGTHDVYIGHQYALATLVTKDCFPTVDEVDYLDFDRAWWWKDYMDELTLNKNKHYFLVGDYFLESLLQTRVILYNKNLYGSLYGNPDGLYDTVLEGKWTLEYVSALTEEVYSDENGNGKLDTQDRLGWISWGTDSCSDPFVYGTDVSFYERTEDSITLNMVSEDAAALCEWIVDYFYQTGCYTRCISTEDLVSMFSRGNVLLRGNSSFGTPRLHRDMEDDFGILPFPKMDEEQQEYRSLVTGAAFVGVLNGFSGNMDITGAVLEAAASETYRTVTPAWYEVALKNKYSRDEVSAQMIDLIRDSATTNFIFAYNFALNDIALWHRTMIQRKSKDYASYMQSLRKSTERSVKKLEEAFHSVE